jgi:hypothetical protein
VVEDDHRAVQPEAQIGQVAVVGRTFAQPLVIAHHVIGRVADHAAGEARQIRQMNGLVAG